LRASAFGKHSFLENLENERGQIRHELVFARITITKSADYIVSSLHLRKWRPELVPHIVKK